MSTEKNAYVQACSDFCERVVTRQTIGVAINQADNLLDERRNACRVAEDRLHALFYNELFPNTELAAALSQFNDAYGTWTEAFHARNAMVEQFVNAANLCEKQRLEMEQALKAYVIASMSRKTEESNT